MKYVLTYYGGSAGATEEEQAELMNKWFAWFGDLGSDLVDGGLPFTGHVHTVAKDGSVSEQPVGEPVTGYSILQADSLDTATEKAKTCPVLLTGGRISVYECADMGAPPE
jgi:hypothetical protein